MTMNHDYEDFGGPSTEEGDEPKGLSCFIDQSRICGPDCMCFLTNPPEGNAYLGENWPKCHLLVNADRIGRHLVVLANLGAQTMEIKRNEMADQQRANQPTPPEVR